jgi:hypothetical protein
MRDVVFSTIPSWQSRGRNGFMRSAGVSIAVADDTVIIRALTGRAQFSDAARIVVPLADLEAVRSALNDILSVSPED